MNELERIDIEMRLRRLEIAVEEIIKELRRLAMPKKKMKKPKSGGKPKRITTKLGRIWITKTK